MRAATLRFLAFSWVLLSVYGLAQAAFGPCSVIVPPQFISTIGCTMETIPGYGEDPVDIWKCGGTVTIVPQQKSCMSSDESPCTNIPNDSLVTYQASSPLIYYTGQASCESACSQDLTTRVATPGGTNC